MLEEFEGFGWISRVEVELYTIHINLEGSSKQGFLGLLSFEEIPGVWGLSSIVLEGFVVLKEFQPGFPSK